MTATMLTGVAPAAEPKTHGARHAGPPLGVLAALHAALFAASLIVPGLLYGERLPSPFAAPEAARDFFLLHPQAVRLAAFFLFASAVPLGLFAASVASRLRFLGVQAAGATIALFGGITAAIFLGLSGLLAWVLAAPEVAQSAGAVRALHLLAFAAGGPGHVVPLGLLFAGVAVPAAFFRLLPRWLVVLGIALAAAAELSTLALIWQPAVYLLPIARFGGFAFLVNAGFRLPVARGQARRPLPKRGAP